MDKLFLTILNMSLTGAFVIAAICLARLPLKKAPKIISYCLWAVAGFRLIFPFSIESVFSLIPFKAQTIPPDIAMQPIPRIDSGIPFVNNAVSAILPAATPTASVNPLQIWTIIGAWVWLVGVAVLLIYGVVSFVILKRKMREAAHIEANIYEAENIKSPFVLGVFKPKIYLPIGLSEQERSYIILHEQTHIKRHDHIVKFAAYFVLCLHWFNPFAWVAFLLMGVDMEMSCDERVLKEMGGETKKDYSLSLLSLATERRIIGGSPLAFGEGGVKERIKNVLNFKKTSRVIIVAAVALAVVLSVGFAVNRINDKMNISEWESYVFPAENYERVFFKCNDTPYNPEYVSISAQLMNNQNVQGLTCGTYFTLVKQVGTSWKIVPFIDGIGFDDIAYLLENGSSFDYGFRPAMLSVKLDAGEYRIVTEVYQQETDGMSPTKHIVWADFSIDRNAPMQEIINIPGEWYGNFDGIEMTIEDMKQFAKAYIEMGRYLMIDDLAEYKSLNFSSTMGHYNMHYVSDSGFSLSVSADDSRVINAMRIRRVSDGEVITINASNYNNLDDFFNGITTTLKKPPSLDVIFTVVNSAEQHVQAAQLAYSWSYIDKNGNGVGIETDSLGPLQLQDYGAVTLSLYDIKGGFMMEFGDNYPPQSVTVRRWDAKYAGDSSPDVWDKSEPVEGNGNWFVIVDDGRDYIYEVYATWSNGSSYYAFRIDSGKLKTGTYINTENTEDWYSSVILADNNEFIFGFNLLSYIATGKYVIEGTTLTLTVNEEEVYTFIIDNGNLIFESGEWAEKMLDKGAVFQLSSEEST